MEGDLLKPEEKDYQRQYRLSLWWVEHRLLLKRLGIWVLAIFDAILLIFALWVMIDTYLISYTREARSVAEVARVGQEDLRAYTLANAAQPLEEGREVSLSIGDGRYDLLVFLTNPNPDWYAEFTYRFTWSGGETSVEEGFILPGQEKPLVVLGAKSDVPIRSPEIRIEDVRWRRVDPHVVKDYTAWEEEHLGFTVEDLVFQTDLEVADASIGRTQFLLKNDTGYSYYQPQFYLLLYRGAQVVGVNSITLDRLDRGEEREVVVNWFGTLPSASRAEVVPNIPIFDTNAYPGL